MKINPNPDAVVLHGTHEPAANTAAIITIAADTAETWDLLSISYSYTGNMAGLGRITIEHGTVPTQAFQLDIEIKSVADTGPKKLEHLDWAHGFPAAKGEQIIITLAAAGAACSGIINCTYR